MADAKIVTLTTDFGTRDPYVAAMKGVLLRECPRATVVDITHEIPPQDLLAASLVLAEATAEFPAGTLHLVVVDPTVGTDRRILAGRFGGQRYLFPDNGVITMVSANHPAEQLVAVSNTRYLPAAARSMTFHGRDVFAPLAAHVLNGVALRQLGPAPRTHRVLELPAPVVRRDEIVGEVIHVDRFGNLVSNIPRTLADDWSVDLDSIAIECAGRAAGSFQGTYAFVPSGGLLALFNSMDLVEVAVNGGSAAERLGAAVGSSVRLLRSR